MNKQIVFLFGCTKNIWLSPSMPSFLKTVVSDPVTSFVWPSALVKQVMFSYVVSKGAPAGWNILCTNDIAVKDSIVILHKCFFNNTKVLSWLKENNNVIVFDVIDGIVSNIEFADAILCCSLKSFEYYKSNFEIPILFTEHCVDLRILERKSELDSLAAYYFGMQENLLIWDSIADKVNVCITSDAQGQKDWLRFLESSNFHYALRPPMPERVFKPFTKGLIASVCNSNMLIAEDDGDALLYLGEDYPYLLKGEPTEAAVSELLQKAEDDFGGKDWQYGLSIMQAVKERASPANISRQFWEGILSL
ncbi:hypothetical protein LJC48_06070 [Desulfovibrio sp. OttesenSCG-928-C06]|nr:hypothetical protein [Desulfovibrio sp. OttesenSCG-928-C06]